MVLDTVLVLGPFIVGLLLGYAYAQATRYWT